MFVLTKMHYTTHQFAVDLCARCKDIFKLHIHHFKKAPSLDLLALSFINYTILNVVSRYAVYMELDSYILSYASI